MLSTGPVWNFNPLSLPRKQRMKMTVKVVFRTWTSRINSLFPTNVPSSMINVIVLIIVIMMSKNLYVHNIIYLCMCVLWYNVYVRTCSRYIPGITLTLILIPSIYTPGTYVPGTSIPGTSIPGTLVRTSLVHSSLVGTCIHPWYLRPCYIHPWYIHPWYIHP